MAVKGDVWARDGAKTADLVTTSITHASCCTGVAPAWRPEQPMLSAPDETLEQPRAARLATRVSAAQTTQSQRAAALSGHTLGEFVIASAQEAANKGRCTRPLSL